MEIGSRFPEESAYAECDVIQLQRHLTEYMLILWLEPRLYDHLGTL